MKTTLRAAFMGSPDFAVPSLHACARACDLRVVVSQPDRPAGRGRKLAAPAVKVAAEALGVPVLQPIKVRDGTLAAALRAEDLDVIVVAAYGRILPPAILEIPRLGCINVHASLLPRWRGAAPIQRAVLAGDLETGVAIMKMEEGLDTGPVYRMVSTPIDGGETSGELFVRLAELGGAVLGEFLAALPEVPPPTPQDDRLATVAPMLRKEEGRIEWSRPAQALVDHVRGMDPWPIALTTRGDEELRVFGAALSERPRPEEAAAGAVLAVDRAGVHVACGEGVIRIAELQPAGKRRMPAQAYNAGRPFASDERLG
ncbi:MAG: methionyl-tRNA formyltransferase [Nannocystaceae bacterium]